MDVFGIAGWSGSGKTTLIERLLPVFTSRGLTVSVVKHAHRHFDIDRPGKDSYRFREAGSHEVLISSPTRWALMREHRGEAEPPLAALLSHLSPCDLVLIEGWKHESMPKLEVHRTVLGKPMLWPDDPSIVGFAGDGAGPTEMPQYRLDDVDGIAALIVANARNAGSVTAPVVAR